MAKRTAKTQAKPKGKETSRSDRVRAEWIKFEDWLRTQGEEQEKHRMETVEALREEMEKKLKALPRNYHSMITQQYSKNMEQVASASEEKKQLVFAARAEWEERLQGAGLQAEDWTDMTPEEMVAVEAALGGDLDEEGDDPAVASLEAEVFLASALGNIPATLTPLTGGQRAHAPTGHTTVHREAFRDGGLATRPPHLDATPFPVNDTTDDEKSHPPYHPPRGGPAYTKWASETSPKSTDTSSSRITATSRGTTSTLPTQSTPQTSPQHSPGSKVSDSPSFKTEYIGPVLHDAEWTPEEAEFEAFKWEIRVQKIREFHDLAVTADVGVARRLADPLLDRLAIYNLLGEHARNMLQLKDAKEHERKVAVDAERDKRRAEIRQRGAAEKIHRRQFAFDNQASRTDTESDSRPAGGSSGWRQAKTASAKKTIPITNKRAAEATSSDWSPPKSELMQVDREHEIWRPVSAAGVTQETKPSTSGASRPQNASHSNSASASDSKGDKLTQRDINANGGKRPMEPLKAKAGGSAGADHLRKKGRSVTIEEVFEDSDSIVPPRPAPNHHPDSADELPATVKKGTNGGSSTKQSSPMSVYTSDVEKVSTGMASSSAPKSAMKTPGKTPMDQRDMSWITSKLPEEAKDYWDMIFDHEKPNGVPKSSEQEEAAKHVRWTPTVVADSDTESVMESGASVLGGWASAFSGVESSSHGEEAAERSTPRSFVPGALEQMARVMEEAAGTPPPARGDNGDKGKRKRMPSSGEQKRKGKGKGKAPVRQDSESETFQHDLGLYQASLIQALNS